MKSRTIVIKRKYLLFILLLSIVLFICYFCHKNNNTYIIESNTIDSSVDVIKEDSKKQVAPQTNYKKQEAYTNMPKEIKGYKVIGKLEIPKIELTTYILSETTKDTLNISATKFCGPKVNGIGNLCITGHNYTDKMFKNLKKLEKNDIIYITDIYDNKVEYVVYDIYKVYPKETECLSQETNGEKQVTLITCTAGAIKRLIVKATEFYD